MVGHPGSVGRGVPWTEQGLSEPSGWLGDVLRGEVDPVNWSGRGIAISPVVDEVGAEPPVEGGAVGPSELVGVALRESGGGRDGRAGRGRDVRGPESTGGTGNPQAAACAVTSDVDG